ncbi:MAG TPA: hypothetical protein VG738_05125 [Chitinophagaceae bacterium]|nr:hypothetical protein [Chitinophagaceae bacterium]
MAGVFDYARLLFRTIFTPAKGCTLHIAEIGWDITIPQGFHLLTAKRMQQMDTRYRKKLSGKTDISLQKHMVKGEFWAEFEIENKFGCSITDLDETPEREWRNKCNDTCNAMLNYFHAAYKEYASVNISTEQETRQKGDILFEVFEISATTPSRLLHRTRYYSAIYKNHGIFITMSFADDKIGEQMLNALRNSTFAA